MNAPNKIFAGTITEGIGISKAWQCYPEHLENSIEYIRKDLLLEWTKENLLECEASNDETDYGRIDVYEKLIDKLNSL